ncbi:unnamed protein product [Meganyctiphanes norvegica]|uniref:Uncharacterized protein n=1 Tax=Meganyctiphanes norvegica TaxID=48144 RepID=A0AAV2R1E3_MEGNR
MKLLMKIRCSQGDESSVIADSSPRIINSGSTPNESIVNSNSTLSEGPTHINAARSIDSSDSGVGCSLLSTQSHNSLDDSHVESTHDVTRSPALNSWPIGKKGHQASTDASDLVGDTLFAPSAPSLPSTPIRPSAPPEPPETPRTSKGQDKTDSLTHPSLSKKVKEVRVGINLVRCASRLLKFLATVDQKPELYRGPVVKQALRRYEQVWLPLAASHKDGEFLLPPEDVHWVWLVHMLAPVQYKKNCQTVVGKLIDHRLVTTKALQRGREKCRKIWESQFPEEPWDVYESTAQVSKFTSKIEYNLEAAVDRQSAFFYQVSLPHHGRKGFLRHSERRYRQFLTLKKTYPDQFLVPCYDMDIMWHTHQVHPSIYQKDTLAWLGDILPHDDSVNDRSTGSRLTTSDNITRNLWTPSFGSTFRREGSMFRSDPPDRYIKPVPESVLDAARGSIFHLQIVKIAITGKAPDGALKIKIKHEVSKKKIAVIK